MSIRCGWLGLALMIYAVKGPLHAEQHCVDFRNFSYPILLHVRVPDRLTWMSTREKTQTIKLTNGVYRSQISTITLDEIQYGDVTGGDQSNAMVVVDYHSGGTAHWKYVYIFNFSSGEAKLVNWFETGSRADAGLYHLRASLGEFSIELFDPARREGDCCSSGFIGTTYTWQGGKFVVSGDPKHGSVR